MGLPDGPTGWAYQMGLPDGPTGWAYRLGGANGEVAALALPSNPTQQPQGPIQIYGVGHGIQGSYHDKVILGLSIDCNLDKAMGYSGVQFNLEQVF